MKVAIVHDWLVTFGGAEKTLEVIWQTIRGDIFTLFKKDSSLESSPLKEASIFTSFLQQFPYIHLYYRNLLWLFPLAVEQFDLSSYDVVVSSSHAVAKGVVTSSRQLHFCYCYTPMRYIWDLWRIYFSKLGKVKRLFASIIFNYLRIWDVSSVNRVDYFIAISNYVARRIKRTYGRDSVIIYPPVNLDELEVESNKEDYYITVSRLVPYKKVDLIVQAFSRLKDRKLLVVGDGPELSVIKKVASSNVEVLGRQPRSKMVLLLKKAKGFVFAAEEDFGISMVEALACGTPVIAYGKGGAAEIVRDGKNGILFYDQTVDGILEALRQFEKSEAKFEPLQLRKSVEKFSAVRFKKELKEYIYNKLEEIR